MKIMKKTVICVLALALLFSMSVAQAATVTETIFSNNSYSTQGIRSVDYIEDLGIYVATGGSAVYTSADGYNWSRRAEVDWNGSFIPSGFAYGNGFGLLPYANSNNRAVFTDAYFTSANNATMVVEHTEDDGNMLTGAAGYYRYLKIKSKLYFDNTTSKFYCFGIENTANGQWKDWGFYSASTYGWVASGTYGNTYTYAIKWTKVNLGAADPYTGTTPSDTAKYTSFQVDGHGRMIFTVETGTVGAWSKDYRGETVLVDLFNNKALNIKNSRTRGPRAGLDANGNVIIIGQGYGNYIGNITTWGGSFDSFISTYCLSASYAAITPDAAWGSSPQEEGAKGNTLGGSKVYMASKPSKFVPVADGIMAIPNGVPSIASGKENDLKVYLRYGGSTLSEAGWYKTVINDSSTLAAILGNGGTTRTVIDACAGPNGQIIIATAIVTDSVKNTQSNIVVLETGDITFDPPANNASRVTVVTTASKDNSAVTAVRAKRDLEPNENIALSDVLTSTVLNGSRTAVANPNMTYEFISADTGMGFDAETGILTAANATRTYNVRVKAICTDDPSVYIITSVPFEVAMSVASSLTVNLNAYNTGYDVPMVISELKKGDNSFSFTSSGTSAEALSSAFLAIALFNADENELVRVACKQEALSVGDSFSPFSGIINIPDDVELSDLRLKIFAWQSHEGGVLQWQ